MGYRVSIMYFSGVYWSKGVLEFGLLGCNGVQGW